MLTYLVVLSLTVHRSDRSAKNFGRDFRWIISKLQLNVNFRNAVYRSYGPYAAYGTPENLMLINLYIDKNLYKIYV